MNIKLKKDYYACYPLPEDKWMIADLWQDSFNDSPEYIEFFFNQVYKPENTLVVKRDRYVVSALQMIPYKAKMNSNVYPIVYLCGVCTHPFERGQGLMKKLLCIANHEMNKREYAFAVVTPANNSLFPFYADFGFNIPVFRHTHVYQLYDSYINNTKRFRRYTIIEGNRAHFPYFNRKESERRFTLLHDEADFDAILQEQRSCGAYTFVALENNIPVGMAFTGEKTDDYVEIIELMTDHIRVSKALYCHILAKYGMDRIKIKTPSPNVFFSAKYGLIRRIGQTSFSLNQFSMSLMHD